MIRTILVPLDGSAFGEAALATAQAIAAQTSARLHLALVHVPVYGGYIDGVAILDDEADTASRAQDQAYLQMIQQRLRTGGQIAPSIKVLDGPIPTTLGAYAAAIDADLVVMTTHGRGGLARFWLGSVADSFVRHSHVPVLLIHPDAAADSPIQTPQIPPRKICVALDGSPHAEQVLGPALALNADDTTEYLFVQIVDAMIIASAPFTPELLQQDLSLTAERQKAAQWYLEKLAAPLRAQGHRIQTRVIVDPQPALAILRAAREYKSDVIALATHGHGGVRRMLLGSVADKVLRAADRPILLYRPQFTAEHEHEGMEEHELVAEHAL
ncbi:MAG: universal stress protein [Chloroflexi bacterium]|nr:universal stress protein [Chloroflexota bacterium]